jgi:arginine decarboxylase
MLAARVATTPHQIILYHAMVGSQLEDRAFWSKEVLESLDGYARLRERAPSLAYFDFGGGMPTGAYSLDFQFDYGVFAEQLQRDIGAWCDERGIKKVTELIGAVKDADMESDPLVAASVGV